MKINPNYVIKEILDETIIIPTGSAAQYFNGLISTNEVAGFVWKHIESCVTPEEIIDKVCENFEVDKKTATEDILGFLETLKQAKMIEY